MDETNISDQQEQLLADDTGMQFILNEWAEANSALFKFRCEYEAARSAAAAADAAFNLYTAIDRAAYKIACRLAKEAAWKADEPDIDDDNGKYTGRVEGIERRGVTGYANL